MLGPKGPKNSEPKALNPQKTLKFKLKWQTKHSISQGKFKLDEMSISFPSERGMDQQFVRCSLWLFNNFIWETHQFLDHDIGKSW